MKPRTEIRIHNNGPAIFVDGRQQVPLAFWRGPDHDYKFLEDFAKAGVRIVFFTVDLKYWKGPGEYDFSGLDEIFSRLSHFTRNFRLGFISFLLLRAS